MKIGLRVKLYSMVLVSMIGIAVVLIIAALNFNGLVSDLI